MDQVVDNSTRETGTHNTLHTGQMGYVDLIGALDGPDSSDGDRSDGAHEDGIAEISQAEVRAEIYPEDRRFQVPKTPATNGKKRNFRGEVLKSGGTTPGLPVNPFRHTTSENTGAMGLSQAFRATQAGTSPAANLLPSDVPSTRPSPAFHQGHRPSTIGSLSSPAILRHTGIQRATTEPQSKYVSMQESQAERRKRQQGHSTSSPIDKLKCEWGFSDDELDPIEQKAQSRERQKRREAEARKQFAVMTEALASKTSSTSRRPELPKQREPSSPTLRKQNGTALAASIKETIDLTTGNLTEDETEHEDLEEQGEESSDDLDELVDDDKENAVRHRVHAVTPRSREGGPRAIIASSNPEMRRQTPSSPVVGEELDELDADEFQHPVPQPQLPITIADSQMSQKLPAHKKRRLSENDQPQARVSSPTSRTIIPQSQAVLHTSQLDSSMKRHLSEPSPLFVRPRSPQRHSSPNPELSPMGRHNQASRTVEDQAQQKDPMAYGSSPPVPMGAPALPVAKTIITGTERNAGSGKGLRLFRERTPSPTHELDRTNSKHATDTTPAETFTTNHATLRSTIPETSSVVRHGAAHFIAAHQEISSNNNTTEKALQGPDLIRQSNSKGSTEFETAQTHLAASPSKVLNQHTSQASKESRSPASPSYVRIRKFNEIAADPSPLNDEGDMDVEINLMTGEDVEFQSLIDGSSPIGPAAKRRRRTYGRRGESDIRNKFIAPTEVASSPVIGGTDTTNGELGVIVKSLERGPEAMSGDQRAGHEGHTDSNEDHSKSHRASQEVVEPAVTQIHHPPNTDEVKKTSSGSKTENATHDPEPSVNHDKAVHKEPRPTIETIASRRLRRQSREFTDDRDIDELAQPEEQRVLALPQVGRPHHTTANTQIPPPANATDTQMLVPNRVLAHFNATCPGFYPATCLYQLLGEPMRFKVRFDDGTTAELHPSHVKRLELRAGDLVKLDQPGARAQTYVVQSLQGKETDIDRSPNPTTPSRRKTLYTNYPNTHSKTDVFGNTTVTVFPKQTNVKSTSAASNQTRTVPLESIYLSQSLFKKLKDRTYTHPATTNATTALPTPSDLSSLPSTPPSRSRRNRASHSSFDTPLSTSKAPHYSTSGLFGNMVFSMTNVSEKARSPLVRLISTNGGTFLDSLSGFRELFTDDSGGASTTTPGNFCLAPRAQGRGFTALLAEDYCRTAKYIQALALDIPCLSARWIDDCVAANGLLSWEPYLLASGESSFLRGGVRSRLLPSYAPDAATLATIISSRPRFLQDQSILLIIGKGNSASIMKNYPFIARALGAKKVERVITAEEGRERLREESFDWVYFYEGDSKGEKTSAESVEAVLFGKGKKR